MILYKKMTFILFFSSHLSLANSSQCIGYLNTPIYFEIIKSETPAYFTKIILLSSVLHIAGNLPSEAQEIIRALNLSDLPAQCIEFNSTSTQILVDFGTEEYEVLKSLENIGKLLKSDHFIRVSYGEIKPGDFILFNQQNKPGKDIYLFQETSVLVFRPKIDINLWHSMLGIYDTNMCR